MMDETKNLIMKILREEQEMLGEEYDLESHEIMVRLEGEGHYMIYDTISRYLREMVNKGLLVREPRGESINQRTRRRRLNYYYKIKEPKTS